MSGENMYARNTYLTGAVSASRLLGRPCGAAEGWSLMAIGRFVDRLLVERDADAAQPILIEVPDGAQYGMAQTALLLHGRLRRADASRLLLPDRYVTELDAAPRLPVDTAVIVMNAPLLPMLEELLLSASPTQGLFLLGEASDWQRLDEARGFPRHIITPAISGDESVRSQGSGKTSLWSAHENLPTSGAPDVEGILEAGGALWQWAALFDAFGIPLPIGLAARLVERGEEEILDMARTLPDLFAFVERDPIALPEPLICTAGEEAAASWLWTREETEVARWMARALSVVDTESPIEAYAVRTLALAMARRGRRRLLRKAVAGAGASVKRQWEAASGSGALAWGRALATAGLYADGYAALQAGLEREPDNVILRHAAAWIKLEEARSQYGQERTESFKAAEADLDRIQEREPSNPYALHTRGEIERMRGNSGAAQRLFDRLSERPESRIPALASAAATALDAGDRLGARGYLRRLGAVAVGSPYLPHLEARLARLRGDYEEMERRFRATLAIDPHNLPALVAWADAALDRGHFALAEQLLRRASELDPESLPVRHSRGELAMEQGRQRRKEGDPQSAEGLIDEAERLFQQILEEEPQSVPTLVSLARLQVLQGNNERADLAITQAAKLAPDNPTVYAARLDTLIDLDDLDRALELMPPSGAGGTAFTLLRLARARLAARTGDVARARRIYAEVMESDAAFLPERLLNAQAAMERDAGELDAAARLNRRALETDTDNAYTRDELAETLRRLGELEAAENEHAIARGLRAREETS